MRLLALLLLPLLPLAASYTCKTRTTTCIYSAPQSNCCTGEVFSSGTTVYTQCKCSGYWLDGSGGWVLMSDLDDCTGVDNGACGTCPTGC